MMLLGAPLTALAQEEEAQEIPQILIEEGEGFELPELLPAEEETAEIPAAPEAEEDPPADGGGEEEEPEGPDGFPAADEEMIGNTTDSSQLATRYELSDLYGQTLTASATFNGKTYTAEKQSDGRYLVRIPNISAHMLGDMITIRGTAGSEFTVQVCALSYVRSVLANAGSTEAAKNGLSSLYAYCAATMAYRNR